MTVTFVTYLFLLFAISHSTPFSPIEAGTFFITADDLQGVDKKTTKQIQLQTPWNVFNQNLNINIFCVISSININQHVSMEFTYKLSDKIQNQNKSKIIFVQITDKNGFAFKDFKLGVNYLVAQNIRTDNYNMTDFQQHLMNQSITQQEHNPSNKQVHNELFLFPNGFSSFNLTHHIMYNYIAQPYDMYTIHYMTGQGEHHQQGWMPKINFINFRWVLFPKYQFGYKSCGTVYETQLEDDFYFNCDKKGIDGYFFGLMGAGGKSFAGEFSMSRKGFSFHVEKIEQGHKYNILAIPYKVSDKFQFIDNRQHEYDYVEQQSFLFLLVVAVALLLIIVVIWVIIKRKKTVYEDLMQEKSNIQIVPSKGQIKAQRSPKKAQDLHKEQKNSDEELKQKNKEKPNIQFFPSDQIDHKDQNFDIE